MLRSAFFGYTPVFVQRAWTTRHFAHEAGVVGEAELAHLARFISPGDLVLDIGANYGVYAWQAQKLGAHVIAFEPNPIALKRLRLIASDHLEIRNIALSNKAGVARMTVPFGHTAFSSLRDFGDNGRQGFDVNTATLDELDIKGVSFIKIDVEGHEEETIEGAMETIRRENPILLVEIEERHNPGGLDRICAALTGLGYTVWFLRDGKWASIAEFHAEQDQDETVLSSWDHRHGRRALRYYNNFLFLPKGHAHPGAH